jgi:tripartite-type tricarboxylate transporter receptor subunit TctC
VPRLNRALLCCGLLVLVAASAQAQSQNWPNRPIKLVVPTGPGAATDVMARLLGDGISRGLGQTLRGS